MKLKLVAGIVGAVTAGVLLAGCGGPAPEADQPAATRAAEPSTTASASTPSEDTSATETTAGSAGSGKLVDPCSVITVKQMSDLTGSKLKTSKSQDVVDTKLCVYTPTSVTGSGAISVTTQMGKVPAGAFDAVVKQLAGQLGGKASDVDVAGAESAKLVTGTTSGAKVVDIIGLSNGVYYQALVTGDGDSAEYQDAMTKVVETLIKG